MAVLDASGRPVDEAAEPELVPPADTAHAAVGESEAGKNNRATVKHSLLADDRDGPAGELLGTEGHEAAPTRRVQHHELVREEVVDPIHHQSTHRHRVVTHGAVVELDAAATARRRDVIPARDIDTTHE